MCGIVGFSSNKVTKDDIEILKKVMIESSIRGRHASGIAWYEGGDITSIVSIVKPIPIDQLASEFDFNRLIYDKNKISVIAHARYSTSDIQYNQPLVGFKYAIAHNGVITQSSPDTWKAEYGYDCVTKNDSELLLRALENGDDVLKKFPDSSIAAVWLDESGKLRHMRNSIRPLWKGKLGDGVIYASTYDILTRAGVKDIEKVKSQDGKDSQRRCFLNGYFGQRC